MELYNKEQFYKARDGVRAYSMKNNGKEYVISAHELSILENVTGTKVNQYLKTEWFTKKHNLEFLGFVYFIYEYKKNGKVLYRGNRYDFIKKFRINSKGLNMFLISKGGTFKRIDHFINSEKITSNVGSEDILSERRRKKLTKLMQDYNRTLRIEQEEELKKQPIRYKKVKQKPHNYAAGSYIDSLFNSSIKQFKGDK